jgi:hypothetical protein
MTGIGPVCVRQPRVRDREATEGERIRYRRVDINDALESAGLMDDLVSHGFEKVGRLSVTNSELVYKPRAIDALNRFIARYQAAHGIVIPTSIGLPTQGEDVEFYRVWLEGLSYVTSSFLGALSAGAASKFTDDPKVITAAAGLGAAVEGAIGAFAGAVGGRGTFRRMCRTSLLRSNSANTDTPASNRSSPPVIRQKWGRPLLQTGSRPRILSDVPRSHPCRRRSRGQSRRPTSRDRRRRHPRAQ